MKLKITDNEIKVGEHTYNFSDIYRAKIWSDGDRVYVALHLNIREYPVYEVEAQFTFKTEDGTPLENPGLFIINIASYGEVCHVKVGREVVGAKYELVEQEEDEKPKISSTYIPKAKKKKEEKKNES